MVRDLMTNKRWKIDDFGEKSMIFDEKSMIFGWKINWILMILSKKQRCLIKNQWFMIRNQNRDFSSSERERERNENEMKIGIQSNKNKDGAKIKIHIRIKWIYQICIYTLYKYMI